MREKIVRSTQYRLIPKPKRDLATNLPRNDLRTKKTEPEEHVEEERELRQQKSNA
jgi:hypothetical protein